MRKHKEKGVEGGIGKAEGGNIRQRAKGIEHRAKGIEFGMWPPAHRGLRLRPGGKAET